MPTIWLNIATHRATETKYETKYETKRNEKGELQVRVETKLYVRERASGVAHVGVAGALRSGFVRLSCTQATSKPVRKQACRRPASLQATSLQAHKDYVLWRGAARHVRQRGAAGGGRALSVMGA